MIHPTFSDPQENAMSLSLAAVERSTWPNVDTSVDGDSAERPV